MGRFKQGEYILEPMTKITKEDVLNCLCFRDERSLNHEFFDPEEDNPDLRYPDCSCDNCFYGRDKLARFILDNISF